MGKRFPVGTVSKVHGSWLGRWREKGERRVQRLGRVGEMNKSEATESSPKSCDRSTPARKEIITLPPMNIPGTNPPTESMPLWHNRFSFFRESSDGFSARKASSIQGVFFIP